jgi:CRISPR-associated endonuclease Csy4
MSSRHYFGIRYLPETADCGLLAGRCISQLHKFMANNQHAMNNIGVVFPRWSADSLGSAIAFVAEDREALVGLSFQPYFSVMAQEELFDVSSVGEVNEDFPEIRLIRNQSIGKSFIGSKRRRMKRSMDRAGLAEKEVLPVANEYREVGHFHRIPVSSESSGQDFLLHIQKELVSERDAGEFNSYGFSTNQDKRGTVPDLKF